MDPWQQRVVDEASDLKGKIGRLRDVLDTNADLGDRSLLHSQLGHMAAYLAILEARIGKF